MARTPFSFTKKLPDRRLGALFLAVSLLLAPAAGGAGERPEGLAGALASPVALRSVFFVRGMSCRACTLILDRHLNGMEGVHWARFNYPLRLLTVYHDGGKVGAPQIAKEIDRAVELSATLLASVPARGYVTREGTLAARWKGGTLTREDALSATAPFEKTLDTNMIERGTEEWRQVAYEIAGEEVRNRLIRERAAKAGYRPGAGGGDIPMVVAKDFYWPVEKLPATPGEAAVSRFLREKVILDDEGTEGRKRFEAWLLALWKEISLDFRAEIMELGP